jgi:hypothetical protein
MDKDISNWTPVEIAEAIEWVHGEVMAQRVSEAINHYIMLLTLKMFERVLEGFFQEYPDLMVVHYNPSQSDHRVSIFFDTGAAPDEKLIKSISMATMHAVHVTHVPVEIGIVRDEEDRTWSAILEWSPNGPA